MIARTVLAATAVLLIVGCNTTKVGRDFDPETDFSRYESFAWLDDPAVLSIVPQPIGPGVERSILAATVRELESQGMRQVRDRAQADVAIMFTIGDRSPVFADQQGFDPGFGWYSDRRGNVDYQTGQLSVDVYDVKTRKLVWHGWAQKSITGADQANMPALVDRTVARLFRNFR